ncbi:MAG: DNA-directed RNA polymerase subunit omega [Chlamydiota bacterium]|nr:DNA-directed RNA polymerase subunit omega [Chlamydiota bacterium]
MTETKDEIIKKVLDIGMREPVLVNAVSKRIRELLRGDKPLVEAAHLRTYMDIALKEILEGKIIVKGAKG